MPPTAPCPPKPSPCPHPSPYLKPHLDLVLIVSFFTLISMLTPLSAQCTCAQCNLPLILSQCYGHSTMVPLLWSEHYSPLHYGPSTMVPVLACCPSTQPPPHHQTSPRSSLYCFIFYSDQYAHPLSATHPLPIHSHPIAPKPQCTCAHSNPTPKPHLDLAFPTPMANSPLPINLYPYFTTTHPYAPLPTTMCHYTPLCTTMHPYAPLHTPTHHYAPLHNPYAPLHTPTQPLCIPMHPYAPLRVTGSNLIILHDCKLIKLLDPE